VFKGSNPLRPATTVLTVAIASTRTLAIFSLIVGADVDARASMAGSAAGERGVDARAQDLRPL